MECGFHCSGPGPGIWLRHSSVYCARCLIPLNLLSPPPLFSFTNTYMIVFSWQSYGNLAEAILEILQWLSIAELWETLGRIRPLSSKNTSWYGMMGFNLLSWLPYFASPILIYRFKIFDQTIESHLIYSHNVIINLTCELKEIYIHHHEFPNELNLAPNSLLCSLLLSANLHYFI